MADEPLITSELNIFFDEEGLITMGGGLHMKVILPGTATVKTIQALVNRVHEYRDSQPEPADTPQDEQEAASAPQPAMQGNRPRGGATEAQCKKILAVCHRLADKIVIQAIEGYPGVEWRLNDEGRCIPLWDFLQSLDKFKASKIIERLERAES